MWPWVRFPKDFGDRWPGAAFDMRCVERVEQLPKGCRVHFKSGGSMNINANWTYLADLLTAWDPQNQGDDTDENEEDGANAQGT